MKKNSLRTGLYSLALLGTMAASMGSSVTIFAHGYVSTPHSRAYEGQLARNTMGEQAALNLYGNIITNPQGAEFYKGFPDYNILPGQNSQELINRINGHIASAGEAFSSQIDIQTADRWVKQKMNGGKQEFTWTYTAPHNTTKWDYYITKKGWDPNRPLTIDEFEKIGTIKHKEDEPADTDLTHEVNVPTDREGYYVILAVWEVSNTDKSFYQVIDVDLHNDGVVPDDDTQAPSVPEKISASDITTHSLTLNWQASTDDQSGVKEYEVKRNGEVVGTVSTNQFHDKELQAGTNYDYTVTAIDRSGNRSSESANYSVTTLEVPAEDTVAPTAPSGLHSMSTTNQSVDLMWMASEDEVGVSEYVIYQGGKEIATTPATMFTVKGLAANTAYDFSVKAKDAAGNLSEASNVLHVTTAKNPDQNAPREWVAGTFTKPVLYTAGEKVSYKGLTYKVLQTHNNYGDTTWAPDQAVTLFQQVK